MGGRPPSYMRTTFDIESDLIEVSHALLELAQGGIDGDTKKAFMRLISEAQQLVDEHASPRLRLITTDGELVGD